MKTSFFFALWIAWSLCFAANATAQLNLRTPQPLPEASHEELVCDGDAGPGSCASSGGAAQIGRRQATLTVRGVRVKQTHIASNGDLLRLDTDGDGQLSRNELRALDDAARRQLLREHDINFDNQLSRFELPPTPEEIASEPSAPHGYPNLEQPQTVAPQPEQEAFQNLRRFGLAANRRALRPARQPFAQAATFGSGGSVFSRVSSKPFSGVCVGGSSWALIRSSAQYSIPIGGCR